MNKELTPLYKSFLYYAEAIRNYQPTTLRNYRSSFKLFERDSGLQYLEELNKEVVHAWFISGRVERKWTSVTFRHYHKHLNQFFKWLIWKKIITENYLDELEKPRMESRLPRTLAANDATKVLHASYHLNYRYRFERYRNRAVIAIMLYAGLRKGEVCNLLLNDVSVENKTIFINQGKGAKDRIIPINQSLGMYLKEYLKDRSRIKADSLYFFPSIAKDTAFGVKGVNILVAKLREKTKLDFSAHTLRHTFATLMLEGGCDIYTLSKIMGHTKITTTTIYLYCSKAQMGKSIEMHALN